MTMALREFALAVYAVDGVAPACLLLQERFGLNVNLLLFGAYVGIVRGQALTPAALEAAAQHVDAWHREVVVPLRSVRQWLKSGAPPASHPAGAKLREQVKDLEIQSEIIELDKLGHLAIPLDSASGDGLDRVNAALQLVVQAVGRRQPTDDERHALTTIAVAAARQIEGRR